MTKSESGTQNDEKDWGHRPPRAWVVPQAETQSKSQQDRLQEPTRPLLLSEISLSWLREVKWLVQNHPGQMTTWPQISLLPVQHACIISQLCLVPSQFFRLGLSGSNIDEKQPNYLPKGDALTICKVMISRSWNCSSPLFTCSVTQPILSFSAPHSVSRPQRCCIHQHPPNPRHIETIHMA